MNYSHLETMEYDYFKAYSQAKEKHKPLQAKLKELSEQLSLTFNSSTKFRIMNEMKTIEDEINSDNQRLLTQKEAIEQKKSELRKADYIKQTTEARSKIVDYTVRAILSNHQTTTVRPINENAQSKKINYQDLLNVITLLEDDSFLKMVELVEIHHLNIALLSTEFLMLYSVWKRLESLEVEIQDCLNMFYN